MAITLLAANRWENGAQRAPQKAYCGPAGLSAEHALASMGTPACTEVAEAMYGLPTSQAGETGRRCDMRGCTKGGCSAVTNELPLPADVREEA